jgi:hypothetical protein
MNADNDKSLYFREGMLPEIPAYPEFVEVYTTTDVHSLARALVRYGEILNGDPANVPTLIHGGRRGPRVHHPVVLDTLWHFATVGHRDTAYWQDYVASSLLHNRVAHDAEALALLVGLPMIMDGRSRAYMIEVMQQVPGIDLNKFEPF